MPEGDSKLMSIEHPTGEVTVGLELEAGANAPVVRRAALLRTCRRLMEGYALVPAAVWDGRTGRARQAAE